MTWVTIISFTYPHEAYVITAKLKSEGIEVNLKDELTTQVNNFYSNAIGGVKVQVREEDLPRAQEILIEADLLKEEITFEENNFTKLDRFTSNLPIIGKMGFELRLILLAIILSLIFLLLMLL